MSLSSAVAQEPATHSVAVFHNKLARQHQYLNTRGMEGRHAGEWGKVTPERQKCVRSQESLQAMLSSGFILKIMGSH